MGYDLWCAKFNFISCQLRLFLSDFEMWSCSISSYTLLFRPGSEGYKGSNLLSIPCFPQHSLCYFPLHNTVKKAITVTPKSVQLVEGVIRCAFGSMDIISGTTLCRKLLPAVLQWTLWFPNPSLLKAIPSHTAHIKYCHISSPSLGRYYNCMFIFIS